MVPCSRWPSSTDCFEYRIIPAIAYSPSSIAAYILYRHLFDLLYIIVIIIAAYISRTLAFLPLPNHTILTLFTWPHSTLSFPS